MCKGGDCKGGWLTNIGAGIKGCIWWMGAVGYYYPRSMMPHVSHYAYPATNTDLPTHVPWLRGGARGGDRGHVCTMSILIIK